jgi:hypothetical protein
VPLADVDRATARRHFGDLMDAREHRKRELVRLLKRNGFNVDPDDRGLQALNDWYRANVAASDDAPDRLQDRWYAVGLDVGLFIGDAIIHRAPSLEWRLFTDGRTDASYHRPVIMGFTRVANPRYYLDPELVVGTHGHRLISGYTEPEDLFVQVVRSAAGKA